jgi:hypothetical protein
VTLEVVVSGCGLPSLKVIFQARRFTRQGSFSARQVGTLTFTESLWGGSLTIANRVISLNSAMAFPNAYVQ